MLSILKNRAALRLAGVLFAALLLSCGSARALDLYWDANGNGAGTGGTGNWNASAQRWRAGGPTGQLQAWVNDGTANACFAATAGTVTLTTGINFNKITFSTGGYLLDGGTLLPRNQARVYANSPAEIHSTIAGTAGLNSWGTSALTLSGSNSFYGDLKVNAGTIKVGSASALGGVNNYVYVYPGGQVDLNGVDQTDFGYQYQISGNGPASNGAITNTSSIRLDGYRSGIRGLMLFGNATLNTPGTGITSAGGFDICQSSFPNGNGYRLKKTGTARLELLSTANNFDQIIVDGGLFCSAAANYDLGTTVVVNSGGSLSSKYSQNVPVVLNGGALVTKEHNGTWMGSVTLTADSAFHTDAGTYLSLEGSISGPFTFTKDGPGSMNIMGACNSLGTMINAGSLAVGDGYFTGNPYSLNGMLTIKSGGTLDLNYQSVTIHQLSDGSTAGGTITCSGPASLTIINSDELSFAGTIDPYVSLTKSGAGTLNLSGTCWALATVSGGRLNVNGNNFGDVFVNSGGTLAGTGTVYGYSYINGTVAPGTGNVGALRLYGVVTFKAGSTLLIDLEGASFDTVNTYCGVWLETGVNIVTTGSYAPIGGSGQTFTIMTNDGYGELTGTFTSQAVSLNGTPGQAFYNYNGSNELVLVASTPPPPPASNSVNIVSQATATPSVAKLGETVEFSVAAAADNNAVSYVWNFGDGTSSDERVTSHSYNTAGFFEATLLVSDGKTSKVQRITVTVQSESENTLTISSAKLAFDFGTPARSSLVIQGKLPLPPAFSAQNAAVKVELNQQSFNDAQNLFSISRTGRFALRINNAGLQELLSPIGCRNETTGKPGRIVSLPLSIEINGDSQHTTTGVVQMHYQAVKDKKGRATIMK